MDGASPPIALRRPVKDRVDDGLPILLVDPVAGSLESEQVGARDLSRERFAVLGWEHRVRGAVDDERGRRDRRERRALAPLGWDLVVVLSRREIMRALDFAAQEISRGVFIE